uniref:Sodium channel protein type 11 subunit alpha n=1 Tax=Zeugodacus cucurbitae TaxID=28588 RepID=A0A0A1XJT5_ZEUCU
MKLLLLFTISTLIVGSINAAILSEIQDITNDLDRQSLAAAAEYLRAPELPKRASNTKVENPLDAAAEYFKAPEYLPNHHKGVDRVAESLAAAAEYLRVPELPERSSRTESEDTHAVAAEYFEAPELPKLNIRNVRAKKNLAAAAEYIELRRKINAARRRMFGTTTPAPCRCYHRPGVI